MAVIVPQRISGDVRADHWLAAVSSRSARTHGWADDDAIDRVSVVLWQAWRCAVPKAVAIQQQNRSESIAGNLLDKPTQSIENHCKRVALGDHLEQPILLRRAISPPSFGGRYRISAPLFD